MDTALLQEKGMKIMKIKNSCVWDERAWTHAIDEIYEQWQNEPFALLEAIACA